MLRVEVALMFREKLMSPIFLADTKIIYGYNFVAP